MVDEAGAATAAAAPLVTSQNNADDTSQTPGTVTDSQPIIEHSKETARASIDRAFTVMDRQEGVDESNSSGDGRDERGRFRTKGPQPLGAPAGEGEAGEATAAAADKTNTGMDVPARFSSDAKAAWATVPDSVKAETNRALRELNDGLSQYQQAFEPLKPYYQLAQKFDTTVHETLDRYINLDFALLSQKPEERLSAIERVLDYAGVTPRDYASFVMGQKPDEAQSKNHATIRELRQEITDLKTQMGGVSQSMQQRREDETLKQVESFAAENPRLKDREFQQLVYRLLTTRMADTLKNAYDMADRLDPAPGKDAQSTASTAATTRPNPAQTRNGNLSITGGPGSGSNPAKRKAPSTARESVDSAFASLGLG